MKSVTVDWFEIPVLDMDRAIAFYQNVFDCKLEKQDMGGLIMAWFPWDESLGGAGGSLVFHQQFYHPSRESGPLVYFSCEDCALELEKIRAAGGEVMIPKRQISPEIGYMAVFLDTEGNRIALYSKS